MIPALSIIILALAWLAHETRCLRVRLLAGPAAVCVLDPETRAAWDTFDWSEWGSRQSGFNNGHYGWLWSLKDWKVPLCGWEWIKQRNHIVPEYRVEFAMNGVRYKMQLNASTAAAKMLGEVMKVNARPHKPTPLPRLSYKGNKPKRGTRISLSTKGVSRRRRVAVAAG